jgi:NAD(P)-dependent dehydrogenase (short-subunit alcohol dehydrogenase family)
MKTSEGLEGLHGRSYVVAGGAGGVGEGIVRALLGAGARVVVPSRERSRLEALRARITADAPDAPENPRLELVQTDVGDVAECERLRDDQLRHGPLHGVVSAIGGWWQGAPLARAPVDDWDRVLRNNLRTPWIVARTFVEALQATPGATYTSINGSAALEPVIDAGPSSVASAALLMMARVLAAEAKGTNLRVNTLVLGPIRTRNTRGPGMPEWLTADEVGAYVAHLVSDAGRMVSGAVVSLLERPSPGAPRAR